MEQPRQRTTRTPEAPVVDRAAFDALLLDLDAALRALADTGERDAACRIAARAWSATRQHSRRADRRLTSTLHYLALPEYSTSRRDAARADSTHPPDRRTTDMTTKPITEQLDVRSEPPARRHTLIFDTWTALAPGTGFELVNDHDPKPLRYQFEAEHPGQFEWDYLEEGPEVWRVRIGRAAS